jgi:hypothetical protein
MSSIPCPAGGHEAGSQPDSCPSCGFHNAFVEQLTQVLVNRAIEELPSSQGNKLVEQLTKAVIQQEIKELPKLREKA